MELSSLLKDFISPHDCVVIGVSGGPDSTALLHKLVEYYRNLGIQKPRIIVAHVNHGIRRREALRDEQFVEKLAKSYGLKCFVKRVKLSGSALEEKGREVRRDFFEQLRQKFNAKWIVTAHTQDDQVETIVFNFLRGSGISGLRGMRTIEGRYVKPFLTIPKSEILAHLKSKKLNFCKDRTNDDTRFNRNFIRRNLLPMFEKINPSFRKTLIRNSNIFGELESWVSAQARDFLKENRSAAGLFSLKLYKTLPQALKMAVIQEAYLQQRGSSHRLPMVKTLEIAKLLERGIGNKKIVCGGGGVFSLRKGVVEFRPGYN